MISEDCNLEEHPPPITLNLCSLALALINRREVDESMADFAGYGTSYLLLVFKHFLFLGRPTVVVSVQSLFGESGARFLSSFDTPCISATIIANS